MSFLTASHIAKPAACVLGSALLIGFSFPFAFYREPFLPASVCAALAFVAWVPLLSLGVDATQPKRLALTYYFAHFASTLISLFWIIIAMKKYGQMSFWASSGVLLSLSATLALFPAMAALVAHALKPWIPYLISFPVTYASFQGLLSLWPLEGFPWVTAAYALFPLDTLLQHLDVLGLFGYNVLLILVNSLWVALARAQPRQRRRLGALAGLCASLFYVSAHMKKGHYRELTSQAETLRMAYVQGNIPQDEKHSHRHRRHIFKTYYDLTDKQKSDEAQLIVWPEAALPVLIPSDLEVFLESLAPLGPNSYLLVGAATHEEKPKRSLYKNSALLVGPDMRVLSKYDKLHLVPFGEYVPYADLLPMSKIVPAAAGDFSRGSDLSPMTFPPTGTRFGTLICYEILFADLARRLVAQGANVLITVTNDAWFDHTSGPYQHFQFLRFRALENRRSVFRSANTGFSGWVDPVGRIGHRSKLFAPDTQTFEIPILDQQTLYTRFPWISPLLAGFFLLGFALRGYFRRHVTSL